jgi:hypothetical protein
VIAGPIEVALRVADALEACGLVYLVGGSLASSISGEPRTTLDVDVVGSHQTSLGAPSTEGKAKPMLVVIANLGG